MGRGINCSSFITRYEADTIVNAFNFLLDNKLGYYGEKPPDVNDEMMNNIYPTASDFYDYTYEYYSTNTAEQQIIIQRYEDDINKIYVICNHICICIREFDDIFEFELIYYHGKKLNPEYTEEYDEYMGCLVEDEKYLEAKISDIFYFDIYSDQNDSIDYLYHKIFKSLGLAEDEYKCKKDVHSYNSDDEKEVTVYTVLEVLVNATATPEMFYSHVIEEE